LRKVDPATFRDEVEAEARAQLASIVERVGSLCRASAQPGLAAGATVDGLSHKLSQLSAALDRAQRIELSPARAFWTAFQREVHPAYESLAAWLRSSSLPAPSLRPTNYARNLFHVGSALVALIVIVLAPAPGYITVAAAAFFASAWTMEIGRRLRPQINERLMALFGPVAHVHERYRVNSATWYATALMLLSLLSTPAVSAIAVAVLGVGDPVAAMVGRRFGRTRLRAGRSLEGSLGFVVSAGLIAFAVASILIPGSLLQHLLIALVAGVSGAVAEVFATRLDDNLLIPLSVAASLTATLALLT
jgi:dolichol kinase